MYFFIISHSIAYTISDETIGAAATPGSADSNLSKYLASKVISALQSAHFCSLLNKSADSRQLTW